MPDNSLLGWASPWLTNGHRKPKINFILYRAFENTREPTILKVKNKTRWGLWCHELSGRVFGYVETYLSAHETLGQAREAQEEAIAQWDKLEKEWEKKLQ